MCFCCLIFCTITSAQFTDARPQTSKAPPEAQHLRFIRTFSGADDVKRDLHPVLNRSLDIVAGPAEAHPPIDKLVAPQGVVTDSTGRVFVADPEAGVVHVFDFEHSLYSTLKDREKRMQAPVAVALDRENNLYVADTALAAILVFDPKGKFIRVLGRDEGEESYFENPLSLAIDLPTRHIFRL